MDKQSKSVISALEKLQDAHAKSILSAASKYLNDSAIEYLCAKIKESENVREK